MAYIEVSKQNYKHNLDLLAKKAGGLHKLMPVLKDNAYGHGLEYIAHIVSSFNIKKVAVKNLEEAKRIQGLFDEVLLLAEQSPKSQVADEVSFAIHDIIGFKECIEKSSVHISIDTGMHRNGIRVEQIEEALSIAKEKSLHVKGVFTHFRSADELGSDFYWQEENYKNACTKVRELSKKLNIPVPAFHSCNSAALLRKENGIEDDYARCGIATYGYTHLPESFGVFDLKPVMALYGERLSTRELIKGERVGYGGEFEAPHSMKVSTYDVGYGDGFFRYDGKEELYLKDKQLLGRVSMDSLSLEGDDKVVCLFDDVYKLAKYFNTISYDILAKLSTRIKRVIV